MHTARSGSIGTGGGMGSDRIWRNPSRTWLGSWSVGGRPVECVASRSCRGQGTARPSRSWLRPRWRGVNRARSALAWSSLTTASTADAVAVLVHADTDGAGGQELGVDPARVAQRRLAARLAGRAGGAGRAARRGRSCRRRSWRLTRPRGRRSRCRRAGRRRARRPWRVGLVGGVVGDGGVEADLGSLGADERAQVVGVAGRLDQRPEAGVVGGQARSSRSSHDRSQNNHWLQTATLTRGSYN